jgi:hypothetical protein
MKYYQVSYIFQNGTGHSVYKTEDGFFSMFAFAKLMLLRHKIKINVLCFSELTEQQYNTMSQQFDDNNKKQQ